jgi:hypothetical protein
MASVFTIYHALGGSFPNISTIDSDDPHELRQQLLVLKAKMNEYRNKAEQAAYEVERRHR